MTAVPFCLVSFWLTQQPVPPSSGLRVDSGTVLQSGTYVLDEPIEIAADNVTLDGGGAVLIGGGHQGVAVRAVGRKGVTVRNLDIRGFYHGVRLEGCERVTIRDCRIQSTHEIPPNDIFLDIWTPLERAYGAGIMLAGCRNATVTGNDLQHQQNGLSMYDCHRCTVTANNASFCSGWGVHLNSSSDNVIRGNTADWCCRIYVRKDGSYHAGADAAALLIVVNSSRNVVEDNMFRGGGDGVFLAGYRHPDIVAPCNDNVFSRNDCSLSPNNAFEATFSSRNRFLDNRANGSNFGFWLGYSTENVVENNEISDNRYAGVAIEHGHANRITANEFHRNRVAVRLWTDEDKDFVEAFPMLATSERNRILDNTIDDGRYGVMIWTDEKMGKRLCQRDEIVANKITNNHVGIRYQRGRDVLIRTNHISGNAGVGLELEDVTGFAVYDNYFDNAVNARASGEVSWSRVSADEEVTKNILGTGPMAGNFWSDFTGRDTDGDHIGDTDVPHRPEGVTSGGDARPLVRNPPAE
ncbi:MAG: right-handed parallel beta-helix repeat-containing protein [Phycisphaerales bacterium]|nr:MAG: right-handed parallel beta-helix repeat-containing protein [Phycisphaerales bacterium]